MEATTKTKTETTLFLNEEETDWLKAAMQNPIGRNESDDAAKFRLKLFQVLGGSFAKEEVRQA